ncbi:MAG TPA: GGDEF domain-containing protein [Candidatus Acidoferrum sp.]|nr:GGDEF domain-containing protein [Candidatus Acidoferrum sp.]
MSEILELGTWATVSAGVREVLMSLRGSDNWTGGKGARRRLSIGNSKSQGRVLSIERGKVAHIEALESLLSSALRSDDDELDQILSALEEISNSLKSGAPDSQSLDSVLQRAASCAIKQSLLDREIRSLAVTDELTGLYNRRGFLASAMHQLKLAHRQSQDVLLLFFDMDNLKGINDAFGHREGDLAIVRAADALEKTFRDSDILARVGGDEFSVLATEASTSNREAIVARMDRSLEKANAEESRYKLSFSIGIARFDPETTSSLGELMARADQDMYADKNQRTGSASLRHS